MNDFISTSYYIQVTNLDTEEIKLFVEFIDDGPEINVTEDRTQAKKFSTREEAEKYIEIRFYKEHKLWYISSVYRLEVVAYNEVNWNKIKEDLRNAEINE